MPGDERGARAQASEQGTLVGRTEYLRQTVLKSADGWVLKKGMASNGAAFSSGLQSVRGVL